MKFHLYFSAILLLLSLLFVTQSASAQPSIAWTREIGGGGWDMGWDVRQTDDLGFIIAGRTGTWGAGEYDFLLIKTDTLGVIEWLRSFGGPEDDIAYSVQQTNDGGYIMAGMTHSFGVGGGKDIWVIKTDATGDTLWSRTYGEQWPDEGYSIEQCDDGGYIIGGVTNSYGSWTDNAILIKIDGIGQVDWIETYGTGDDEGAYCARQTSDGGFILSGYHRPYPYGPADVFAVRTTPFGEEIWSRFYDAGSSEQAEWVEPTNDGGFVFAGWSDPGYPDIYILKTDISGLLQWDRLIGDQGSDDMYCVRETWDGNYVFAGTWYLSESDNQVYVLKTSPSGSTIWELKFGGDDAQWARHIEQTADGGYILVGASFHGFTCDLYLIRLTPDFVGVPPESDPNLSPTFGFYAPQPNPFRAATIVSFDLRVASNVELEIYDVAGRLVATLVDEWKPAGRHKAILDGSHLPAGVYLARITTGDWRQTQKLVLLK